MNTIQVRRAGPEDAPAFARMMADEDVYGQLLQLPFPDPAVWRKRLEAPSEPGRADIHLVAELDGEVVGSAGVHSAAALNLRRRHALALGISVAKPAQGRGVGTALMEALIDYADRWAGVLRIELIVWVDNERAIRFYQKFGFEIEGRLRAYGLRDGRYDDVLAMARLHPRPPVLLQS
jgi:L-phenylalanine/L-methionine N-acetyltransferase